MEGGQSHECPSPEVLVFDADLAQKLVVLRRKTLKNPHKMMHDIAYSLRIET